MVVMDTNYAAPRRPPAAEDAEESRGRRQGAVVAFVLAVLVQVYLLYLYDPGPSADVSIPHADKIVHAVLFAGPAFLAVLTRLPLHIILPLLILHAPVSELVQHRLIAGRAGEPFDVVADLVGVGLGMLAGRVLRRFRQGPTSP